MMAVLEDAQDIESGPRQASAVLPDGKRKSVDARTGYAEEQVSVTRGHAFVESLMHRIPQPIQGRWKTVVKWLQGPDPPQAWKIPPLLPRLRQLPLRLVDRLLPSQWQCIIALFVFYVCWVVTFAAVLHESSIVDDIDGYGSPVLLDCGSTFWYEIPIITQVSVSIPDVNDAHKSHQSRTGPRTTGVALMVFPANPSRTVHLPSAVLQAVRARKSSTLVMSARRRSSIRLWSSAVLLMIPPLVTLPLASCIEGTLLSAQLPSTLGSSQMLEVAAVWSLWSASAATIPA